MRILSILLLFTSIAFHQDTTKVKINEYKRDLETIRENKQKKEEEIKQKMIELKELSILEQFHLYKIKLLSDTTKGHK